MTIIIINFVISFQFIFTDIKHNAIFVTKDHGKTFERIDLHFTPSEISFHELYPSKFLVLDKNNTKNKVSTNVKLCIF